MEITNIIKEDKNLLLNRREIELEVHAEIVPSKKEVEKILSEKYSANPENIKIKRIKGKFGSKVFKVESNIYNSKKDKDSTETMSKKERQELKKPVKVDKSTEASIEKAIQPKEAKE